MWTALGSSVSATDGSDDNALTPAHASSATITNPVAAAGHPGAETGMTAVTLISGDQVFVQDTADGPVAWIGPQDGVVDVNREFVQNFDGDSLQVIPTDLLPLVPERLDPRLFDVTLLAQLDNPTTMPVIVELVDEAGLSTTNGAPAIEALADRFVSNTGIDATMHLSSIGAVAAEVDGADVEALLDAVRQDAAESSVEKVWLSGPVYPALDDSTAQIGAPEAWAAGLTGQGVTVAVLDTGIDSTHPDLADQVVGEVNFTSSSDASDQNGHGTHVAAIVAGAGNANASYTGVAFGAELLNVKVLGDDGMGDEAWVIAGMEWAVDQGADVVNLSLGGAPTDGTDPMAAALNNLSGDSDALFVVAAGNDGWQGAYTVGTPGSADLALTVGSVDEDDVLAWDSSRGPRVGDDAVKPDVTAPGERIISARADGTDGPNPIDEHYTEASGTSAAAPHVAGAAAILLQDRPDLTGPELKALLMGSALSTVDSIWEEGAGRIVIPSVLTQSVFAQPASMSLGTIAFPDDGPGQVTEEVVYHNTSDSDVELDLTLTVDGPDGGPVPAGVVELSADQVTIEGGGSATLEITVDPLLADTGLHSGAIVGTAPDGRTVRIPLGFNQEPELFDLTVTVVDRDGNAPPVATVDVLNMDNGETLLLATPIMDGAVTLHVPEGTYRAGTTIGGTSDSELAVGINPSVVVTDDTEVILDMRDSVLVSVETHLPSTPIHRFTTHTVVSEGDVPVQQMRIHQLTPDTDLYVLPSGPATVGLLEWTYAERREADDARQPMGALPRLPYRYEFFTWDDRLPQDTAFVADQNTTATVRTVHRTLSTHEWTTITEGRLGSDPSGGLGLLSFLFEDVIPHERIEFVSAGVQWLRTVDGYADWNTLQLDAHLTNTTVYEVGADVVENWNAQVNSTGVTARDIYTDGSLLFINLPAYVDSSGHGGPPGAFTDARIQVWRDGDQLADFPTARATFTLSDEPADMRILLEIERDEPWWPVSTYSSSEWTFTAQAGEGEIALPVLDIRFEAGHLSPSNQVSRVVDLDVIVAHQRQAETTATIDELAVEWSADGGWQSADLTEVEPGRYRTQITPPAGTATIDLRASASDTAGSTLTTEVRNALALESSVARVAGLSVPR